MKPRFSLAEDIERFWAQVDKSGLCWLWTGGLTEKGYGRAWFQGKKRRAHRLAYFLTNGRIPTGLNINHHCDVRNCVNPEHLWVGTQKENMQDAWAKGRGVFVHHSGEDHPSAKLTDAEVAEIRVLKTAGGMTQRQISKIYNVSEQLISNILTGSRRSGSTHLR